MPFLARREREWKGRKITEEIEQKEKWKRKRTKRGEISVLAQGAYLMEKKWNFAKAEPRWKYHHLFYSAVNGTRHLLAVPLHPVSLFAGIALNLPNVTWERAKERKAKEGRGEEEKKRENGEKKGGREPRPINRSGSNFSRETRVQGKAQGKMWHDATRESVEVSRGSMNHGTYIVYHICG